MCIFVSSLNLRDIDTYLQLKLTTTCDVSDLKNNLVSKLCNVTDVPKWHLGTKDGVHNCHEFYTAGFDQRLLAECCLGLQLWLAEKI